MTNLREEGRGGGGGGTRGTRKGRYEEGMRKERQWNGQRRMWGIMKDEEAEEETGFYIHLKMPQLHPQPAR